VWPGDRTTFFAAAGGAGGVVDAYRPGGPVKKVWRHRVDGDAIDVVATVRRVYLVGHYEYVLGENTIRRRVTEVANWSRFGHNPPAILQLVGNFRRYVEEVPYNSERQQTHRRRARRDCDERPVPPG
jgi:hypothetical protein